MAARLYNERVKNLLSFVAKNERLPMIGEVTFSDGMDMRLWFNGLAPLIGKAQFVDEVFKAIEGAGIFLLNDKEKETEFLDCVSRIKHIPYYREEAFSDNSDMYSWYMNYRLRNSLFERSVCNCLPEFNEFDINTILDDGMWIAVRIFLRCADKRNKTYKDVDMMTIVYKLIKEEPARFEKELLQVNAEGGLTQQARKEHFLETIRLLGYVPDLQEVRFADFVDMYTWYNQVGILDQEIVQAVRDVEGSQEKKKYNIYLFPSVKNTTGGAVYVACRSEEALTIVDGTSLKDALNNFSSLKRTGAAILPKDGKARKVYFFPKVRRKTGGDTFAICRSEEAIPVVYGTTFEEVMNLYPDIEQTGMIILPRDCTINHIGVVKRKKRK